MSRQLRIAAVIWIVSAGSVLAQRDLASLPTRDVHDGLLVAADAYQDSARSKERFGKKNPHDSGILAIEVFFRNDNDKAIRLNLESIRLMLSPPEADRQRLEPLAVEEVVDRILNKGRQNPAVPRQPVPIPGRGPKTGRGKDWDALESVLRNAAFEMDILPPRSSVRGFFFFDMNRRFDWVSYTRLYIPDLQLLPDKKPLLFFEVNLKDSQPH